jgi:methyl acetate hydrolase
MSELDDVIRGAVAREDMPFAVGMVGSSSGTVWSGSAGPSNPGRDAGEDTVFRIFSMSKAIGGLAAMLLVDRGKLSLDTEVESILPEFSEVRLLESIGQGGPVLRKPARRATVRHLATHTSGFSYEFWNPLVPQYQQATGSPSILAGTKASMFYPLSFEPGERWDYGIGIDWLGLVVQAVDGRRVDRFCQEEILQPLGMHDTAFEPEPSLGDRLAGVKIRGEDGRFGDFAIAPPANPEVYGMGHALYSTAGDYLRFLRMVLNRGTLDGRRLLSESGVATMLANHIGTLQVPVLKTTAPPLTADVDLLPGTRKTHGIAFMRFEQGAPGMRGPGSHGWAGVLNTHYWIDPARDIAAVLMTQSLPFGEPRFMATYEAFERATYRHAAE